MAICGVCGKNSILPETYGTLTLCKKCAMKIITPTWKNAVYSTNDELIERRDSVIQKARKSAFSQEAISALEKYFNGQIVDGLIKLYDGCAGQILTVIDDHFVIDTREEFDYEEIEREYRAMVSPLLRGKGGSNPEEKSGIDGEVLASAAHNIISGFASGASLGKSVMRASATIAAEMTAKDKKNSKDSEPVNVELRITFGRREFRYSDFSDVVLRLPIGEEDYGFVKFQKGLQPNAEKDVLFFFSENKAKEIKKLHAIIQEKISLFAKDRDLYENNLEQIIKAEGMQNDLRDHIIISSNQKSYISAPEELMKWKQLLDVQAITQEEYNAKKKQLLGL